MSIERPNRLSAQTSPYLLQHAHNPVDWYPWGEEALEAARRDDRPILLSIGYAACHWCHVMERESFENAQTAALMNREFVCIKVDREERPDVDDIYMRAVQLMTGHGGWPLTCFLTPDMRPFYGGTYFPPEPRGGMPAFRDVLAGVADAYRQRRTQVEQVATQLSDQIRARHPAGGAAVLLGHDLVNRAATDLHERFDPNWGGFGGAPKFPNSTGISLLLREAHRHHDQDLADAALFTLDQMAAGGIRDQVGGGFHRYATDARWLVPHFEKMLYDNALLCAPYLDAYRLTGDARFAAVVRSTCEWVLREMQTPAGGFAATLDADSEGVEGKFYVWSQAEIERVLGDRAAAFCTAYGVSTGGNWEGVNILHLPRPLAETATLLDVPREALEADLAEDRELLLQARDSRIRPGLDDKVLADWNGLMIASLAVAARVLDEPRYLAAATGAATFVLERMRRGGRLLHSWRAERADLLAYLDDYAAMTGACVELFLSTFEMRWLHHARDLARGLVVLFWDETDGGFFLTGADHEELLARPKSGFDGATPSGNGLAVTWLQRLAVLLDDDELASRATQTMYAFEPQLQRLPSAFTQTMLALDDHLAARREIVVVGALSDAATRAALQRLWRRYAPHDLVVALDPDAADAAELRALPLFAGKAPIPGATGPTLYVCRDYACSAPTTDLDSVLAELDG